MCNFVIRPITSYATIEYRTNNGIELEAGQAVKVLRVHGNMVVVDANNIADEPYEVTVPLATFVHMFTANPDDIKAVKEAEYKTMGYNPNKSQK